MPSTLLIPERPAPERDELLRMLRGKERVSFREFMDAVTDGRIHQEEIEEFWPGWAERTERLKSLIGEIGVAASERMKVDMKPLDAAMEEIAKASISTLIDGVRADRARLSALTAPPDFLVMPPPPNRQLEALLELEGRLGELVAIEDRQLARMVALESITQTQGESSHWWNITFLVIFLLTLGAATVAAIASLVK